jgi:hypothetical protein
MRTQNLTQRLQTMLEHLKQAQELGSKLSDYAEAFGLNVKDLYNGRAQLQRKGLWPKARSARRAHRSCSRCRSLSQRPLQRTAGCIGSPDLAGGCWSVAGAAGAIDYAPRGSVPPLDDRLPRDRGPR